MSTLFLGILIAMIWGAAGFWLRQHTKLTLVEVSALLALTAGLILPRIFVDGGFFALVCTAVSYAAMCSDERMCSYGEMLVVSIFCALILYFGQNILVGVGGRLGTSAAVAVLLLVLIKSLFRLGSAKVNVES